MWRGDVRGWRKPLALAAGVGLLLAVTGCGAAPSSSTGNGGPAGTSAPATATRTATATASATGCPAPTQVVNWPSAPNVVLGTASVARAASVTVGQTVEVALPWGARWMLLAGAGAPALQLQQPAGYGDASTRQCIWRFVARQTGASSISFSQQPLCTSPHTPCPQYIRMLALQVNVRA
jgi:hypothetical protein